MITLTVIMTPGQLDCVSEQAFVDELQRNYDQNTADDIYAQFETLMAGSTVPVISSDPLIAGVYTHDLKAVAEMLRLPIRFIDQEGNELYISSAISGLNPLI